MSIYRTPEPLPTFSLPETAAAFEIVCKIFDAIYPGFNEVAIRRGFIDIENAFYGRYPGLLECDTPYHDLRHALDSAVLMARMLDGYQISRAVDAVHLDMDAGCLGLLLALFHDIGFLRRDTELHMQGAHLARIHEQRSVDFMQDYLAHSEFARYAEKSRLIHVTDLSKPVADTLAGLSAEFLVIAQMLGTSDLLGQISGRNYLENCRDYLFQEFVIAGLNRVSSANGGVVVLYETSEDLLRQTPVFYERVVHNRLEIDFGRVYCCLTFHFGGDDPYTLGLLRNLAFLNELIASNDFSRMHRIPMPLIPKKRI